MDTDAPNIRNTRAHVEDVPTSNDINMMNPPGVPAGHDSGPPLPPLPESMSFYHRHERDVHQKVSLYDLKGMYDKSQAELQQREKDVQVLRERYKKTAMELNKLKAQGQMGLQVTDEELVEKVTQLRYNIKTFGIRYFQGEITNQKPSYNQQLQPAKLVGDCLAMDIPSYTLLMQSPAGRPKVIRALLWAFLCNRLFDQFRWAATVSLATHMFEMAQFLRKSSLEPFWRRISS